MFDLYELNPRNGINQTNFSPSSNSSSIKGSTVFKSAEQSESTLHPTAIRPPTDYTKNTDQRGATFIMSEPPSTTEESPSISIESEISTPTIVWDIFDFYQFEHVKSCLFYAQTNIPDEELFRISKLQLSPRFEGLDERKMSMIDMIMVNIMTVNIGRLGRGEGRLDDKELREIIEEEVITLGL